MDRTQPVINTSLQRAGISVDHAGTALAVSLACKTAEAVTKACAPLGTSLKRGVNENDHSDAADSFCGCCFAGAGRTAAARSDAFLRRK